MNGEKASEVRREMSTSRSEVPVASGRRRESAAPMPLSDSYGRVAKKLRIMVTDRCNYRCDFCMPNEPIWLDRKDILSFEEIARVARVLTKMGVEKIRLSGGEPLVRRDVEDLVKMLAGIQGLRSLNLTTNGSLLRPLASRLKENGLTGVTVSLHSLKPERYAAITGSKNTLPLVLEGIEEARRVGLPLKINCVVRSGNNEDEIVSFAELAREWEVSVRFIEYMPFDGKRVWDMGRVMSGAQIVDKVSSVHRLVKVPREPGGTATSYRFKDSKGEIATITSMTQPFCGDCDRIRLTADGKIVPCLFSTKEYDVRALLRGGASEEDIAAFIRKVYSLKFEGVESLLKQKVSFGRVRPMHTIGG